MIFQKYGDMPEWPITTSEIAIPRAISMVLSLLITFGVADDDIIYYFNGRIFTLKRSLTIECLIFLFKSLKPLDLRE